MIYYEAETNNSKIVLDCINWHYCNADKDALKYYILQMLIELSFTRY